MARAIALGEKGRITAPPNPWVGCVIVKDGHIIGEGYHHKAGEPHAEVNALKQAGKNAEGATVYSTLEPCSHFGRTPPCAQALIDAKVSHVYIAVSDPDSNVSGKGCALLKNAGIGVTMGIQKKSGTESLAPYLHHRRTGRPYCVVKAAISLDGRTAAADNTSQWITCEAARGDAHRIRAESQAIIVGAGTALHDQPRLTVRNGPLPSQQPLRVVLDSFGRVPHTGPLFDTSLAPTVVFTTKPHPAPQVETIIVSPSSQGVDLEEVMNHLGKRGIIQVMIEGGATLLGSVIQSPFVDSLVLYFGPRILGDKGLSLFQGMSINTLADAPHLRLYGIKQIGECIRAEYLIK